MEAWILISIAAAAFQTLRFMLQRNLAKAALSPLGATLARFVFSAPVVVVALATVLAVTELRLPGIPPIFWLYAFLGGLSQILATAAVVALFQHRNFAVGITFKKTEVIQTAILSVAVLGERLPIAAFFAIGAGLVGVLFLSDPPETEGRGWRRFLNRAAGLGLLSGFFFGISAVGYRGASLSLEEGSAALRAATTLAFVTSGQAIGLIAWLHLREKGQVTAVLQSWRSSALVGGLSLMGSYCWFLAFTLQSAAYVFAVGQVEVIFSLLVSAILFGERIRAREYLGIAIVVASVVALTLI